ncbi:hypothetical protein SARC_15713, partial [Sphaeroforma arctica JP610]
LSLPTQGNSRALLYKPEWNDVLTLDIDLPPTESTVPTTQDGEIMSRMSTTNPMTSRSQSQLPMPMAQ